MKRFSLLIALALGVTLTTAAAYATTAESVAKDLVKGAQKGDFNKFQKHMTGPALRDFGTTSGMALIQQRAAPFKKIEAKQRLIASSGNLNVYDVDVYGKDSRSLIVTVREQCAVSQTYSPGYCTGWGGYGRWGWHRWGGYGTCWPGDYFQSEDCAIVGLSD